MKVFKSIILVALLVVLLFFAVDFVRFPECYMTTWKAQLKRDIESGKTDAIEYYENAYVANNRPLFEEVKK